MIACSGKVYYDLVAHRREAKSNDVAIIRVEQLYPFPHKAFDAELKKYPNATEVVWCRTSRRTRAPGSSSSTTSTEHEGRPEAGIQRPSGFGVAGGRLLRDLH